MWLVIVRHAESEKNTAERFASSSGLENLTVNGGSQVEQLCESMPTLLRYLKCPSVRVLSGTNIRTSETAHALSAVLQSPHTMTETLDSFVSSATTGKTMQELWNENPITARNIYLYRAGLANSYTVHPAYAKEASPFEDNVAELATTLMASDCPAWVIVSSRSPLTALLIHFARLSGSYPEDFYGYVELPTASVSVVKCSSNHFGEIQAPIIGMVGVATNKAVSTAKQMLADLL